MDSRYRLACLVADDEPPEPRQNAEGVQVVQRANQRERGRENSGQQTAALQQRAYAGECRGLVGIYAARSRC